MAKLPRIPSLSKLQEAPPEFENLPVGTRLWRIYFRGGAHPTRWNHFRHFGPVPGGRFDHHVASENEAPREQERGILYAALEPRTCLAEVFQRDRIIDRWTDAPWLVAFEIARTLELLDLTGEYTTRVGASAALMTGPRPVARQWASAFYDQHCHTEGLYYPSSMHANRPSVALYERAGSAGVMPEHPVFHRALSDPAILTMNRNAARALGYGLV